MRARGAGLPAPPGGGFCVSRRPFIPSEAERALSRDLAAGTEKLLQSRGPRHLDVGPRLGDASRVTRCRAGTGTALSRALSASPPVIDGCGRADNSRSGECASSGFPALRPEP